MFSQGQNGVTLFLNVTNSGTASTSGTVTVLDNLPAGFTATAISGAGWSCTVATVTCTRNDALPAGSSYPLTVTANVNYVLPYVVINTVVVSGGGEIDTANDQSSDILIVNQVPPPALVSIAVTPANPSIANGLTQHFTATGTYTDSSTQNLTSQVTWASATTGVATISAGGLATAAGIGASTISATLGAVNGSTFLTVTAATLVSIAVTPANPSIVVGTAQQFQATGTYTDGSTQDLTGSVTWASAKPAVAAITGTGRASTIAVGMSTISATLGAGSGSTTLTVTPLGPCDVIQHGLYTVSDAQAIINEALGAAQALNDMNGDHIVNVVDIAIVINAVLNLGCTV
jgi:hypothetical protein